MALVYVLDADQGTKVGMSALSDQARLSDIQRGCGMTFRVVQMFEFEKRQEAYRVEQLAHYFLRADRHIGEWFWCHPLDAVAAVECAIGDPTSARELRFRAKWVPRIAKMLADPGVAA